MEDIKHQIAARFEEAPIKVLRLEPVQKFAQTIQNKTCAGDAKEAVTALRHSLQPGMKSKKETTAAARETRAVAEAKEDEGEEVKKK